MNNQKNRLNIIELFEDTFKRCQLMPALTDYPTQKTWSYLDLSQSVAKYHLFFELTGIKKGDKIALMSDSSASFVIAYVAIVTYGAVCVPILQGFSSSDASFIINHSDSKILLTDLKIWSRISDNNFEAIIGVYDLNEGKILESFDNSFRKIYEQLPEQFANRYPNGFTAEDIKFAKVDLDDTMIISYTSGTTGSSKGVMISVRNITANTYFARSQKPLHYEGSRALSILPLAHAFACAFDLFYPLSMGVHVTLLGKTPSPAILLKALAEVKPRIICIVPLVIEKIVKGKIFPTLRKQPVKFLTKIPGVNRLIYNKVLKQLMTAFGGELVEFETGGAALDPEVEKFLLKIKFPFTVGYGMTECAPLVSYDLWYEFVQGSVGTIVYECDVKIDNPNQDGIGEVCVKGEHVMQGYYKNPELTAQTIDKDGWLHTGDMGFLRDGKNGKLIFLRGRSKTMILSADGQNIYPEEIEFKLNDLDYVSESFVYSDNGRLIALVYPDYERAKKENVSIESLKNVMADNLIKLNENVGSYERIKEIKLISEPFVKTPKQSVKRNLYPQEAVLVD